MKDDGGAVDRKAFEDAMARNHPLMSLAWDMDYNEYVYDEANHMFYGFCLAMLAERAKGER